MTIQAVVRRKGKTREGKGFSRDELKEAGIGPRLALKLSIPIDLRRRTIHAENIELLKQYLDELQTSSGSESKTATSR